MTCKELAEKLLETPDLPVTIDAHKGYGEPIERLHTEMRWFIDDERKETLTIETKI